MIGEKMCKSWRHRVWFDWSNMFVLNFETNLTYKFWFSYISITILISNDSKPIQSRDNLILSYQRTDRKQLKLKPVKNPKIAAIYHL